MRNEKEIKDKIDNTELVIYITRIIQQIWNMLQMKKIFY